MATTFAAAAMCQPQPAPCSPITPNWHACAAARGSAVAAPASVGTAPPGADLPRIPSDASLARLAAGVKRSHSSAFEPFPLGGSARRVLARRASDGCAAPASPTSGEASETASATAVVEQAGGHDCATSARAAPLDGAHTELLRLAFRLLPRLEPAAAALLLAQMRALVQRGRAAASQPAALAAKPAARPAAAR